MAQRVAQCVILGKQKKNTISIRGGSDNTHRTDVTLSAEVKDRELRFTLWLGLRL